MHSIKDKGTDNYPYLSVTLITKLSEQNKHYLFVTFKTHHKDIKHIQDL